MELDSVYIRVIQDKIRSVDCWFFGENPVDELVSKKMLQAHNDVLDMFLCEQPLVVVMEDVPELRGSGEVSALSKIIHPEFLSPPYNLFMVNSYFIEILDGKTMSDKLNNLIEFGADANDKEFLISWMEMHQENGVYIVAIPNDA